MKYINRHDEIELSEAEIAQAVGEWIARKRKDLELPPVSLCMGSPSLGIDGEPVPMINFIEGCGGVRGCTVWVKRELGK